jgi:hypothetical protein
MEDNDYSILNPPSFEGQGDSRRFSGPPLSAGGPRETGGESLFDTPLRQGGLSHLTTSGGVNPSQVSSVPGRIGHISPSLSMQSPSGWSQGPQGIGGSSKLLPVVFIDQDGLESKCCGQIGNSGKFCVADKHPHKEAEEVHGWALHA